MSSRSDDELIEFVQNTPPEDFSPVDLEELRSRLRTSPRVREALLEQLSLESQLTAVLGRYEVSVDAVVAAARSNSPGRYRAWGFFLILLIAVAGTGIAVWSRKAPEKPADGNAEIAQAESLEKQKSPVSPEATPTAKSEKTAAAEPKTPEKKADNPPHLATNTPPADSLGPGTEKPPTSPMPPVNPPPTATWRREIEAEKFAQGNVRIDNKNMGRGIGIIHGDADHPLFAEYQIKVPQAGKYRLELRYASKNSRPLKVLINGQPALSDVAASTTKDWKPQHQTWFPIGEVVLKAGENVVRLVGDSTGKRGRVGQIPAIDKLALTTAEPLTVPVNEKELTQPIVAWSKLVDRSTPVSAVTEASFATHGEQWGIRREVLQQWLEPVPNTPHQFHETQLQDVTITGIDGILKLRAPWPEDAVLRMSAYDHMGLRIHFWMGTSGVTLQLSDRPTPWWGAYATHGREPNGQPQKLELINSDEGRYDRSSQGAFEVRYQTGTLVLSRGDVRLMTVPCSGPPEAVYFEGRAWLRHFTMYRGSPLPEIMEKTREAIFRTVRPAELDYQAKVSAGAELVKHADGRIELKSVKTKEPSWALLPIEGPGLYEVIALVEQPTIGAGLVLADLKGEPVHRVGFFRDNGTKKTCLGFLRPGEVHLEAYYDPRYQVVPFTGSQTWIRLVLGQGSLKCWVSGDGRHWGRALDPLRGVRSGFSQVGLYCLASDDPRSITLQQLEVRRLSGLTDVVPEDLLERAPQLPADLQPELWLGYVSEHQPPEMDPELWRQACALKTLAYGPTPELGKALLSGLTSEVIRRPISVEDRIRFLDDLSLLCDTWEHGDGQALAMAYEELGKNLYREGHAQPATVAAYALLNSPLWTAAPLRATPEGLSRQQLFVSVYNDDWPEVARQCRWLRFWNESSHPYHQPFPSRDNLRNLVQLFEVWSLRAIKGSDAEVPRNTAGYPQAAWRHPLIETLSKEGYNVLAELNAALSGHAYKDACQIVTSAQITTVSGLLPSQSDSRLSISLPQAIAMAMEDHPQFQKALRDNYEAIGRLRVRQAVGEGRVEGVHAATLQFFGTDAAGEAHRWLGDRALAGGNFALALSEYRRGWERSSPGFQADLAPRMELARAIAGEPATDLKLTRLVDIGGQKLSPQEFQTLLQEVRQHQATRAAISDWERSQQSRRTVPAPSGWKITRTLKFEGDAGQHAGSSQFAGADTAGREFSLVTDQQWLWTNNRFQTTAYDLNSGERKWVSSLGGEQGDSRSWPQVGMGVVLQGDRLFVRRIAKHGPELGCLDKATGNLLWKANPGSHVISEPLLLQEELFAFYLTEPQIGVLYVHLGHFDRETGELLDHHPVMQFHDAWNTKVQCGAVVAGEYIIANMGGTVLCCDARGEARWLRKQVWLPPVDGFRYYRQHLQTPLITDQKVFVTQPGVWAVECLDLNSGRKIWGKPACEVRRIVGRAGQNLLVENEGEMVALNEDTGELAWSRRMTGLLDAAVCNQTDRLLVARTRVLKANERQVCLAWLDTNTGEEKSYAPLPTVLGQDPQAAEMVTVGNRVWLTQGQDPKDHKRNILELTPDGEALPGQFGPDHFSAWTPHVAPELRELLSELLPHWTLLTPQATSQGLFLAELGQAKELLELQSTRDHPVVLARRVKLSDRPGGTKLRLISASKTNQPPLLTVRVNDQVVYSKSLLEHSAGDAWQMREVDLQGFAGKTVWLQIAQDPVQAGQATVLWKRLELIEP